MGVLVAQMMTKGAEVVHTLPFGASSNLMKLPHHFSCFQSTYIKNIRTTKPKTRLIGYLNPYLCPRQRKIKNFEV
jgi:hypothetical protein